jgi:hypothetical protein
MQKLIEETVKRPEQLRNNCTGSGWSFCPLASLLTRYRSMRICASFAPRQRAKVLRHTQYIYFFQTPKAKTAGFRTFEDLEVYQVARDFRYTNPPLNMKPPAPIPSPTSPCNVRPNVLTF